MGLILDGIFTALSAIIMPFARGVVISYTGIHGMEVIFRDSHFEVAGFYLPALLGIMIGIIELIVFQDEARPLGRVFTKRIRNHWGYHRSSRVERKRARA